MPTSETELTEVRAVEEGAARGQCYVCFEDDAPPSRCGCKDRFMHEACMLQLVQRTGKMQCSVCLQDYKNLKTTRTQRCTRQGICNVLVMLLWPWFLGFSIWRAQDWLASPYKRDDQMLPGGQIHVERCIETVLELLVTVMVFLCIVSQWMLYRRGHWRLLMVRAEVTRA